MTPAKTNLEIAKKAQSGLIEKAKRELQRFIDTRAKLGETECCFMSSEDLDEDEYDTLKLYLERFGYTATVREERSLYLEIDWSDPK